MDYSKRYQITSFPGQYLTAFWNRGYRDLQLYDGDRLMVQLDTIGPLRKGYSFQDPVLGKVDLRLSEQPKMLDVVVNNYHSSGNVSHPKNSFKMMSFAAWLAASLFLIRWLMEGMLFSPQPVLIIYNLVSLAFLATMVICAVFIRTGKPWAFFTFFGLYALITLTALVEIVLMISGMGLVFTVFKIVLMVYLCVGMKTAISLVRHQKFEQRWNEWLIDQPVI